MNLLPQGSISIHLVRSHSRLSQLLGPQIRVKDVLWGHRLNAQRFDSERTGYDVIVFQERDLISGYCEKILWKHGKKESLDISDKLRQC